MAKKVKASGPSLDYFKIAVLVARAIMCVVIMYMGMWICTDSGERLFNKFMHSLRKMAGNKSKPGDIAVAGKTWNEVNILVCNVMGVLALLSGLLILAGRKALGGIALIIVALFMMATKDNYWIVSDVSVIKREKAQRLENFCRDVSLIGAAIMFIGGYGM